MSNIAPIHAKSLAKTITPEPSPALKPLLDAERLSLDDLEAAVRDCPALIDEATGLLPSLHRRVEAGGEAAVRDVIGVRLETYPQPQRSEAGWAAWWGDYYDALADQPLSALEAGMRAWVRTDTTGFMPKPGQLLALVKTAAEPLWRAVSRANRIAKLEPPAYVQHGTVEERKAMAQEVRKLLAVKTIPPELDGETEGRDIA